jgi:hypothetical protein
MQENVLLSSFKWFCANRPRLDIRKLFDRGLVADSFGLDICGLFKKFQALAGKTVPFRGCINLFFQFFYL